MDVLCHLIGEGEEFCEALRGIPSGLGEVIAKTGVRQRVEQEKEKERKKRGGEGGEDGGEPPRPQRAFVEVEEGLLEKRGYKPLMAFKSGGLAAQTFVIWETTRRKLRVMKYCDWEGVDGNGKGFLVNQVERMRELGGEEFGGVVPEVMEVSEDEEEGEGGKAFFYVMEYCPLQTLSDFLDRHPKASHSSFFGQLDLLLRHKVTYFLDRPSSWVTAPSSLTPSPSAPSPTPSSSFNPLEYLHTHYLNRVQRRIDLLTNPTADLNRTWRENGNPVNFLSPFFRRLVDAPSLLINNHPFPNLPHLLSLLHEHPSLLPSLAPLSLTIAHGDEYTDNVGFNVRKSYEPLTMSDLVLFDLRGATAGARIDPVYDLGKIAHSFFVTLVKQAKALMVDVGEEEVEERDQEEKEGKEKPFSLSLNFYDPSKVSRHLSIRNNFYPFLNSHQPLLSIFQRMGEDPSRWLTRTRFAEAIHIACDAPNRIEDDPTGSISTTFYAISVVLLTDFLRGQGVTLPEWASSLDALFGELREEGERGVKENVERLEEVVRREEERGGEGRGTGVGVLVGGSVHEGEEALRVMVEKRGRGEVRVVDGLGVVERYEERVGEVEREMEEGREVQVEVTSGCYSVLIRERQGKGEEEGVCCEVLLARKRQEGEEKEEKRVVRLMEQSLTLLTTPPRLLPLSPPPPSCHIPGLSVHSTSPPSSDFLCSWSLHLIQQEEKEEKEEEEEDDEWEKEEKNEEKKLLKKLALHFLRWDSALSLLAQGTLPLPFPSTPSLPPSSNICILTPNAASLSRYPSLLTTFFSWIKRDVSDINVKAFGDCNFRDAPLFWLGVTDFDGFRSLESSQLSCSALFNFVVGRPFGGGEGGRRRKREERVVVLGARGLLGRGVVRVLEEEGYENVIGTYWSSEPPLPNNHNHTTNTTYHKLNLHDSSALSSFLFHHPPTLLIHCCGIMADQSQSHPLLSLSLNSLSYQHIQNIYKGDIIYISTDRVFGPPAQSPPYLSSSFSSPTLTYGKHKRRVEKGGGGKREGGRTLLVRGGPLWGWGGEGCRGQFFTQTLGKLSR